MKWPWGSHITQIQAKEAAKFLLGLCQATIIGTAGYSLLPNVDILQKILVSVAAIIVIVVLFLVAMKLLKEVKPK